MCAPRSGFMHSNPGRESRILVPFIEARRQYQRLAYEPNAGSEESEVRCKELGEELGACLGKLRPRSKTIVEMSFGINRAALTRAEIAGYFGISRPRVDQILAESLRHLRRKVGKLRRFIVNIN